MLDYFVCRALTAVGGFDDAVAVAVGSAMRVGLGARQDVGDATVGSHGAGGVVFQTPRAVAGVDAARQAIPDMLARDHPDKVASMGEEYQKGAQEKFMKIQEAYDNIKKKRGFK